MTRATMAIVKRAWSRLPASSGIVAIFSLAAILVGGKKISLHSEKFSRMLSSDMSTNFEAFLQQQGRLSSPDLPTADLTAGRKMGLKVVRCTRITLKSDWKVGRMAKITGSGWTDSAKPLSIQIMPDEPSTEVKPLPVEPLPVKPVPIVDDGEDENSPDNPDEPPFEEVVEEWEPETDESASFVSVSEDPSANPGNSPDSWEASVKKIRRLTRQARSLKALSETHNTELGDQAIASLFVKTDGRTMTAKRFYSVLEDLAEAQKPPSKSVRALARVSNRWMSANDDATVQEAKAAFLVLSAALQKANLQPKQEAVDFVGNLLNRKVKAWRRKEGDRKSSSAASAAAFLQTEAAGESEFSFDDVKEVGKRIVSKIKAFFHAVFGEKERETIKLHTTSIKVVKPDLHEGSALLISTAIGGRPPTREILKGLIKSAPEGTNVAMPKDEDIDALIELLPKGRDALGKPEVKGASSVLVALSIALEPQKEKYLPALKEVTRDAAVSMSSVKPDADLEKEIVEPKAVVPLKPVPELSDDQPWRPILGFDIRRVPLERSVAEEEAKKELKKDGSPVAELAKNDSAPAQAALKSVVKDRAEEIQVTGPHTCTFFITKTDGGEEERGRVVTPMISPEQGFMVIITRTQSGYEFDLFGWTTLGSMSSWRSIHVDNIPVEIAKKPRVIMASEEAGVKTLRYYVSEDMDQDESKCEEMIDNRDCVTGPWSSWTPCTTTCGLGEQHRAREVISPAVGTGRCESPLSEVKYCNVQLPCSSVSVDCEVDEWGPFGPCSVTCGTGEKVRTRNVTKQAVGNGLPCPNLTHSTRCYNPACPSP